MRIHYLGTAAAEGIPGIFCNCENCRAARRSGGKNLRARSQVLIDDDLLVDFSPDTYLNSVRHGVELSRLRALLITHSHSDHFIPNELEMHGALFAKNLPHSFLDIYCNDRVYGIATRHMLQYGADYDAQEVTATLRFHQVMPMDRFTAAGCQVTALRAHHDANETCLIYLIEKEGKRILYANDTGIFFDEVFDFLSGKKLDLVSLDCTNGTVKSRTGRHMGFAENAIVVERLQSLGCITPETTIVSTHFSHNGILPHEQVCARTAAYGAIAAYDGMILEL